jgi:hypothetical protein
MRPACSISPNIGSLPAGRGPGRGPLPSDSSLGLEQPLPPRAVSAAARHRLVDRLGGDPEDGSQWPRGVPAHLHSEIGDPGPGARYRTVSPPTLQPSRPQADLAADPGREVVQREAWSSDRGGQRHLLLQLLHKRRTAEDPLIPAMRLAPPADGHDRRNTLPRIASQAATPRSPARPGRTGCSWPARGRARHAGRFWRAARSFAAHAPRPSRRLSGWRGSRGPGTKACKSAGRSVGRPSHSGLRPEDRLPGRANEVHCLLSLHDVG